MKLAWLSLFAFFVLSQAVSYAGSEQNYICRWHRGTPLYQQVTVKLESTDDGTPFMTATSRWLHEKETFILSDIHGQLVGTSISGKEVNFDRDINSLLIKDGKDIKNYTCELQ